MNNKVSIVMYHYVRDLKNSRYPEIKGLDYDLFKEQISFFKNNFQIIKMEELIDAAKGGGYLPDKAMLLTFDDGYIDHYTNVFPILDKYGLQGSFFPPCKIFEGKVLDVNKIHFILASTDIDRIISGLFVEIDKYRCAGRIELSNDDLWKRYAVKNRFDNEKVVFVKRILQTGLNEDIRNEISTKLFEEFIRLPEEQFTKELYVTQEQLHCMKKAGMYIGLHGYDHYWLGDLTKEEAESDINKALSVMSGLIDQDDWVMNYPYGSYNIAVENIIRNKGCSLALTTDVGVADITKNELLRLPRLDTNDFPPKSENYLKYYEKGNMQWTY